MMLEWLGDRSGNNSCQVASKFLEDSIEQGFADKTLSPMEFGGPDGTKAYGTKLISKLDSGRL